MKFLFDLFPVILFFGTYKFYGIYTATAVLIAASIVQVSVNWFMHKRIEKAHIITLVLVAFFGGLTLILQDEMFIKWKPSVINWLFGIAFIASHFLFGGKTLIERMMGEQLTLPAPVWARLNIGWAIFFVIVGFVNLYVVYNFDTDTWVDFKLFGIMGATFGFIILQGIYIARYLKPEEATDNES